MNAIEVHEKDKILFDDFVNQSPWGDLLQLWEWGEAKKGEGWAPIRTAVEDEGRYLLTAQILAKNVPGLGAYFYIPHGPLFVNKEDLKKALPIWINSIKDLAKIYRAFAIEIEPKLGINADERELPTGLLHFVDNDVKQIFTDAGFLKTARNMQPIYKLFYDLSMNEEELLSLMKKNTRYNVRLAEKKGVEVKEWRLEDAQFNNKLKEFYTALLQTQERAKGYPIRPWKSFTALAEAFKGTNYLSLYEATYEGNVLAYNISQRTGTWSSSFYAASYRDNADVKAPYLLRWRSVLDAKLSGSKVYDFWGIIPNSKQHEGYTQTKLSFGGYRINQFGIWALPINKFKYNIWNYILPLRSKVYNLVRTIKR